jgi:hypothetical protein
MQRTVLTFGLISGLMISVLMDGSLLLLHPTAPAAHSMVLGYTMMLASFLLVYFGVRSYRDNTLQGQITFPRALLCGALISAITCLCYVVSWEVLYFRFLPHFMDPYFAAQVTQVRQAHLDPATTGARIAAIQHSQALYQNPLVNAAYTLLEPLPVALVFTTLSAILLRRIR